MGLIERGRAAWSVLRGSESTALVRSEPAPLIDLPLQRRQGSGLVTGPGFRFLPSIATRKGARRGTWDLLNAYSEVPALRLCVDLLSGARARLEFEFYRAKKSGTRSLLRSVADPRERARLRRAMIDTGDLEPLEEHPILDFIRRGTPSPMLGFPALTGYECRVQIGQQKLLTGESFVIIERRGAAKGANKRGLPFGNIAVKSVDVTALPTAAEPFYVIRDADGIERQVPMEDVLYRREPNPADIYGRGTGPAHALSTELEIDELQAQHMADSWAKGTRPDLLIVGDFAKSASGGPFGASQGEAAAQTARLEMDWEQTVRRGRPHFFPGVDMDGKPNVSVHDLSRTMEQMQANAMRSQTWGNIAQVIGRIPPELRGETGNSNRATIEAAWYVLQTGTLLPMAVEECDFIRERILPEFPDTEGIEVDWLSPVDRDAVFDLQVMTNHKEAFDIDEKRALAGKPEIPGGKGKVFLFSPGTVPVRDPSVDPLAGAGRAPSAPPAAAENEGGGADEKEDGGELEVPASEGEQPEEQEQAAAQRSALVPGQDQLHPEAALRGEAGGSEGGGNGAVRGADVGVGQLSSQGGGEGAVVEGRDASVEVIRKRNAEFGEIDVVVSAHGGIVSTGISKVNQDYSETIHRAAPYVLIDRIAAAVEPRLRDLFLAAVERRRGEVDEAALVAALEAGNMARALDVLGADAFGRDLRRVAALLGEVFGQAGEAAAASLAEQLGASVEFNRNGTRALSWAPQRSEDLARWARESAEETARAVVERGQADGWEAAQTAGAVLLTLGLAARLAEAVLSHRAELVTAGEPLEAAQAAAASYRDNLLQNRAAMFGGDQAYSAAQAGQGEAWRQARETGKLPAAARRYWVTRDDPRVCPVCNVMHGQKRDLDEKFDTFDKAGEPVQFNYPGEPHDYCRCALLIVNLRGATS